MAGSWFEGWAGSWTGGWLDSFRMGMAMAGGAAQDVASWVTTTLYVIAGWLLLVGIIAALLVARAASGRGRSGFGWLVLAVLMTPPLAGLLLLLMPDLGENRQRQLARRGKAGLRLCPSCAEVVRAEARCCRYCGVDLDRLDRQQAAQAGQGGQGGQGGQAGQGGQGRQGGRTEAPIPGARGPTPVAQRTDPRIASPVQPASGRRPESLLS